MLTSAVTIGLARDDVKMSEQYKVSYGCHRLAHCQAETYTLQDDETVKLVIAETGEIFTLLNDKNHTISILKSYDSIVAISDVYTPYNVYASSARLYELPRANYSSTTRQHVRKFRYSFVEMPRIPIYHSNMFPRYEEIYAAAYAFVKNPLYFDESPTWHTF